MIVGLTRKKDKEIQIKFTVNEEQKRRLDAFAKQRELSVPQFAKLTALGVRMTPAPVVFSEEKELLEEILQEFVVLKDDDGKPKDTILITSSIERQKKLLTKIKTYLKK